MNIASTFTFQPTTRLRIEIALIILSVAAAAALHFTQAGERLLVWDGTWAYVGIVVAGALYASVFTVAFSLVALASYATDIPLPLIAILGGIGAALADSVIFSFVRDELSEVLVKWVKHLRWHNSIARVFGRPHVRNSLLVTCGIAVIGSPLPDEVGVVLLGASSIPQRAFTAIAFVANGVGIGLFAAASAAVL